MSTELVIEVVDGVHRIDSRVLATRLGYEHETIVRSITRHKARLETKSVLRQFVGKPSKGSLGGRPESYYMLDERQCLILTGNLKKGDEAEDWRERLIDAFLEARERVRQLESQQQAPVPAVNNLWERRAILFNQHTHIPDGYWCIFREIASECCWLERRGIHLREDAVPDISVGLLWMKEVRRLNLDERYIQQYPHHYPDRRGMQYANIYPNAWLGLFRDWFQSQYLRNDFRPYVQRHALQLPPLSERRQLGQG